MKICYLCNNPINKGDDAKYEIYKTLNDSKSHTKVKNVLVHKKCLKKTIKEGK